MEKLTCSLSSLLRPSESKNLSTVIEAVVLKNTMKKTKSPPMKPKFQSVKQMKKSAPEKSKKIEN